MTVRVVMNQREIQEAIVSWLKEHGVTFPKAPSIEWRAAGNSSYFPMADGHLRVTVEGEADTFQGPYR